MNTKMISALEIITKNQPITKPTGLYQGQTKTGANLKTLKASEQLATLQLYVDRIKSGDKPTGILFVAVSHENLAAASEIIKDTPELQLAAQDIDVPVLGEDKEHTGLVLAPYLKKLGVKQIIVGHSETTSIFRAFAKKLGVALKDIFTKECEHFAEKAKYTLDNGLDLVMCFGEDLIDRFPAGKGTPEDKTAVENVIKKMLTGRMALISKAQLQAAVNNGQTVTIAYEPVWAIGTGVTATNEQAAHALDYIRSLLIEMYGEELASTIAIQYGGSDSPATAKGIALCANKNGSLVGGWAYKKVGETPGIFEITKENNAGRLHNIALQVGRPDTIKKLFPNSKALIIGGNMMNEIIAQKGQTSFIAANGRNEAVIKGALEAAQEANSGVIIEIAKSEGGIQKSYCPYNYLELATKVDKLANEMGITIPIVIHADHYGIKSQEDIETAKIEIPQMIEAGITSIAIDASHMPDHKNLLANIELSGLIPEWMGYETEIGEIIGKAGVSSVEDALFLIAGLNAHGIFPNWIAVNNGTTHGVEASDAGIQVGLTKMIHEDLMKYSVKGAQHGTSGNNNQRLKDITMLTQNTKANLATALQMISWGLKVNEFGNAETDAEGNFIKVEGQGVSEELWAEMMEYAAEQGWSGGNIKQLNKVFEDKILAQPQEIKDRMVKRVKDFMVPMMIEVFNSQNSADLVRDEVIKNNSPLMKRNVKIIENPEDWGVNITDPAEKEAFLAQKAIDMGVSGAPKAADLGVDAED